MDFKAAKFAVAPLSADRTKKDWVADFSPKCSYNRNYQVPLMNKMNNLYKSTVYVKGNSAEDDHVGIIALLRNLTSAAHN